MILVLFAVPQESRGFSGYLQHAGWQACGMVGSLSREEVAVVHTGMGRAAAGEALQRALAEFQPSAVISSGFAGGLAPELPTEALVAAENFSAPSLLRRIPPDVRVVRFTSTELPLDTPQEKRRAFASTGAAAVDLESETIADCCRSADVPLLVLRIVSDAVNDSLPLPSDVAYDFDRQRVRTFSILKYLADRPAAIPPLIQFTRRLPHLQQKLADALVHTIDGSQAPLSASHSSGAD